jgi:hypothetical protein
MKKLLILLIAIFSLITPAIAFAATTFPINGGTGSTTLSGILLGNGTSPVQTLGIGTNLTLTGGVLSATGSGAVSSVFTRTGAVIAVAGDYTTALVTEVTNLYFTNARAIGSLLTGYVSGAGTISASDSVLSAIQKLNGNIVASALVGTTGQNAYFSGTNTVTGTSTLFISPAGNIGIGTTSPSAILDANGMIRSVGVNVPSFGAGAEIYYTGNVAYFDGYNRLTGTAIDTNIGQPGQLRVAAGGNVGIGTTTPTNPLTLPAGTVGVPSLSFGDTGTGFYRGFSGAVSIVSAGINDANFSGGGIQSAYIANVANSSNSGLALNNGGGLFTRNVADANTALTVYQQNAGSTGDILDLKNSAGVQDVVTQAGFLGIGTTSPYANLSVMGGSSYGSQAASTLFAIGSSSAGTATSTLFTVLSSGNVGIGTSAPAAPLEIGTVVNSYSLIVPNSGYIGARSTGGTAYSLFGISSANDLVFGSGNAGLNSDLFYAGGLPRMTIASGGNVGIGTTTPWARLSVDTSSLAAGVPEFTIGSSTRQDFVVTQAGFLGIGTTSPMRAFSLASGQIVVPNGTVGAPSYSFANDPTTGMFATPGVITMSVGGLTGLYINASGFRFPSGRKFSDSGTGNSFLTFTNTNAAANSNTNYFEIVNGATGVQPILRAFGNDTNIDLTFTPKGTGNTVITNGNVGIGTTTPTAALSMVAASTTAGTISNGYQGMAAIFAGLENTVVKLFMVIDQWGHVGHNGDPTLVSACGTGPSIAGNDIVGAVTLGTGLVTSCTITFSHPFPVGSAVHVMLNQDSGALTTIDAQSITTTGFTIIAAGASGGIVVSYMSSYSF